MLEKKTVSLEGSAASHCEEIRLEYQEILL